MAGSGEGGVELGLGTGPLGTHDYVLTNTVPGRRERGGRGRVGRGRGRGEWGGRRCVVGCWVLGRSIVERGSSGWGGGCCLVLL